MTHTWFAMLAGVFFGLWQVIIAKAGFRSPATVTLLMYGSAMLFVAAALLTPIRNVIAHTEGAFALKEGSPKLEVAIAILVGCGILSGLGQMAYQKGLLVAIEHGVGPISVFVGNTIMQAIVISVGGAILYGEKLTSNKLLSVVLAVLAMYFAKR